MPNACCLMPVRRKVLGLANTAPRLTSRIVSLDQFRGYTVAGMFLVNFLGDYAVIPEQLKHHGTYCSLADTIMPQFFFAVGFAYRLTFLRDLEKAGAWAACRRAIKRNLALILLGAVIYHLDGGAESWAKLRQLGLSGFFSTGFRASIFQALVHIGLTGLWILPVIRFGPWVRALFLVFSALLQLWLSLMFYSDWVYAIGAYDGGPLGFLTWTIPTLAGSLAYDVVAGRGVRGAAFPLAVWSVVLMVAGYAISCGNALHYALAEGGALDSLRAWLVEPPFVPPSRPVDFWTMSQTVASVSYLTFGAGFSLLVYVLFIALCDLGKVRVGLFRTFGQNALAAYVIHDPVLRAVQPFVPKDSPLWYALTGFLLFFGITYLFVRYLEKHGIYLRL